MNRREALKQSGLILGYTLSASTLSQLWTACKSEPQLTWKPQFFTEAQAKTVSAMAECILPRTETPGAKDLGIDQYIDVFVKNIYSEKDQQNFTQGIQAFEEGCQKVHGKTFANLSAEDQEAFLLEQEKKAGHINHAIWGETIGDIKPVPFYRQFKAIVISAYFSSEEVGKNLLTYEPVPGDQKGCIPLSEVGNVYSL
ncbi:gluconate 2-dehydrogenase subunit 3 family protein [Catalinimonas sp. 4WD22]|uniref:gluconate 2-dehydrogenase subunit 3 family protein n=1 Tax=Catalinimonas locisalis TaxID=3133978 RepID=UPI003100C014